MCKFIASHRFRFYTFFICIRMQTRAMLTWRQSLNSFSPNLSSVSAFTLQRRRSRAGPPHQEMKRGLWTGLITARWMGKRVTSMRRMERPLWRNRSLCFSLCLGYIPGEDYLCSVREVRIRLRDPLFTILDWIRFRVLTLHSTATKTLYWWRFKQSLSLDVFNDDRFFTSCKDLPLCFMTLY